MFFPFNVDVPMSRLPMANWALIAVTSVVSIAILIKGAANDNARFDRWRDVPLNQISDEDLNALQKAIERSQEAQPPLSLKRGAFSLVDLFGYVLVHADIMHLLGNMVFLFVFGNAINARLGHAMYLGCYFLLGAISGLGWLILGNGPAVVGASGAIMGAIGIFLVLYPRNDVRIFYFFGFVWNGVYDLSALWLILFYMMLDLVGTIRGGDGIAYAAHVAGALSGMVLAIGLLKSRIVRPVYGEENLLQVLGWQKMKKRPRRKD